MFKHLIRAPEIHIILETLLEAAAFHHLHDIFLHAGEIAHSALLDDAFAVVTQSLDTGHIRNRYAAHGEDDIVIFPKCCDFFLQLIACTKVQGT